VAKIKPYEWLSEIWGKCNRGETVFRRFRKTIVVEANPSPSYTRTDKQDKVRKAYAQALREWRKLSDEEKEYWREKGRILGLPAYQTYMKYRLLELLKVEFHYEITIDNSNNSNDLQDYQILLIVNNDSEFFSTVKDKKYMEFYDEDKETLLNHYVEEWDDVNYNAKIWIKIPLIPANSIKKIYLKVNENRTTDLSDPEKVFDFYDDFLGDSLNTNKWTTKQLAGSGGSYSISDSVIDIYQAGNSTTSSFALLSALKYSLPLILEFKSKLPLANNGTTGYVQHQGLGESVAFNDENNRLLHGDWWVTETHNKKFRAMSNGNETNVAVDIDASVWHIYKIVWNGSESKLFCDDALKATVTENIPSVDLYIKFEAGTWKNPAEILLDWVRIRKFADPEPSVSYVKLA